MTDAPPSPPLHVRDDGNSEESDEESTNGQIYLSNVDTALQEIREKAETVAANSVVLQTSNSNETLLTRKDLLGINMHAQINCNLYYFFTIIQCQLMLSPYYSLPI